MCVSSETFFVRAFQCDQKWFGKIDQTIPKVSK
jgi:hypothetical protein